MQRITSLGITGLFLLALSSTANAQTIQSRFEMTFEFYDPCNDEVVAADVVTHLLLLPDGVQQANQNGVAVGLTTGNLYQWNNRYALEFVEIIDEFTITSLVTGSEKLHLISHGASPNLELTTILEFGVVITFDPVTGMIDFQPFDHSIEVIDCRGSAK